MTEPDGRYGEELRRALSAVVDPVQPVGDGLEKIRARATHRPPVFAWFTAYVAYLPAALVTRIRIAASWAGIAAADPSILIARLRSIRHWPRRTLGVLRRPDAWLRPALAVTGAVALVVTATLLVPRLRHSVEVVIVGSTSSGATPNTPGGQSTGPGQPQGTGSHRISSAPYSSGVYSSASPSPCVPPRSHGGGGSGHGTSGTPTVLIPFGPMPGASQPVQPAMLGLLPPSNPPGVVPNSCYPPIAVQPTHQPGSTPTVSQPPVSTPPVSTPTSTPPTTSTPTSPPPTTPTSTPPTTSTPQGSTSPTGQVSASPIPG